MNAFDRVRAKIGNSNPMSSLTVRSSKVMGRRSKLRLKTRKASASTTKSNGATIRWWSPWPLLASRCSIAEFDYRPGKCDRTYRVVVLHNEVHLNDLTSDWAYRVIASLAWNLKAWSGLMIKPSGTAKQKEEQAAIKSKLIGMDFTTLCDRLLMVPAQIIRRSRTLVYRLLSYRPCVDWLLLIDRDVRRPLRC